MKVIVIICLVLIGSGICAYIWHRFLQGIKQEVNAAPRIPMFICPANPSHGAFPASAAIEIEVLGLVEKQKICTFCYHEKMKAAEKIFKK